MKHNIMKGADINFFCPDKTVEKHMQVFKRIPSDKKSYLSLN